MFFCIWQKPNLHIFDSLQPTRMQNQFLHHNEANWSNQPKLLETCYSWCLHGNVIFLVDSFNWHKVSIFVWQLFCDFCRHCITWTWLRSVSHTSQPQLVSLQVCTCDILLAHHSTDCIVISLYVCALLSSIPGAHPGICLAVMTGHFVPQVLSIKADKISNTASAGLQCRLFRTGNSISPLTLHSIITKQQHPCLV